MKAFTPATYALTCAFACSGIAVPGRPRGTSESHRAKKAILWNGGGAKNLREAPVTDAALEFHLPEAILRVHVAEPEERIGLRSMRRCAESHRHPE